MKRKGFHLPDAAICNIKAIGKLGAALKPIAEVDQGKIYDKYAKLLKEGILPYVAIAGTFNSIANRAKYAERFVEFLHVCFLSGIALEDSPRVAFQEFLLACQENETFPDSPGDWLPAAF